MLCGSLASKTWNDIKIIAIYSLIGLILSLFCIRGQMLLSLGDDTEINLGFNVAKTRIIYIICYICIFSWNLYGNCWSNKFCRINSSSYRKNDNCFGSQIFNTIFYGIGRWCFAYSRYNIKNDTRG